jgi:hypothetical protein
LPGLRRKGQQVEAAVFRSIIILLLSLSIIKPVNLSTHHLPAVASRDSSTFEGAKYQLGGDFFGIRKNPHLHFDKHATLPINPTSGTFTVVGALVNLSGDKVVFTGNIVLTIFERSNVIHTITLPLMTDGSFEFKNVPYDAQYSYLVSYTLKGIKYRSQEFDGSQYSAGDTVTTQVPFYSATTDTDFLRGEGMHVTLDFSQEGNIHVSESMIFFNPSTLVIIPVDKLTPMITFDLPDKASSLKFFDTVNRESYRVTDGGFGDWEQILPGNVHQVAFEYDLPFDGDTHIELTMPIHMDTIIVMKTDVDSGVSCLSGQLVATKTQQSDLVQYYNGQIDEDENILSIHCVAKNHVLLTTLAVTLSVSILLAAVFIGRNAYVRRKKKVTTQLENQKTQIMDSVIVLDDKFKANELSKKAYEAKRSELIKKLENGAKTLKRK